MKKLVIALVAVLTLAAICFADAGPGPPQPEITVKFTKNGAPYTEEARAIFHCGEVPLEGTSPMAPRDMELTCSDGICKNERWFYKFNPCFYAKNGSIKYILGGGDAFQTTDENIGFPEGKAYEITIGSENGGYQTNESAKLCPLSILGFGVLGFGIILGRRPRGS